jgi:hypothetical protein
VRGMQKYLIEYKTNIMLHFQGVRQIVSVNEKFFCSSSYRRRQTSKGRRRPFMRKFQGNEKEMTE